MADFKLVIGDSKKGKSYQKEVRDNEAKLFMGKKIGEKIDGGAIGLEGYELEITGGSDYCGFPMRKDVNANRKRILAVKGVGFKKTSKGMRHRKTVCGSRIHGKIVQVNLKILKHGKEKLGEDKPAE